MNVTGIIAEYNPFHLGHAFHLREARRITGADYLIVVMSGDFVQRGEPALTDKYLRAKMALSDGADLVIELPVAFATAGGEDFAGASVALLDKLGIVSQLVFGSESGKIDDILSAARLLEDENAETQQLIRMGLKSGLSYPAAVSRAVAASRESSAMPAVLFSSPNNLLAMEYCRALKRRSSSIRPMTIQRLGNYHDTADISADHSSVKAFSQTASTDCRFPDSSPSSSPSGGFVSASALRRCFDEYPLSQALTVIRGSVSPETFHLLEEASGISLPVFADDFSDALFFRLLGQSPESLSEYLDVSPDMAGRVLRIFPSCHSFSQLAESVKCKSYTRLRINRALLHCLLGITDGDMADYKQADYVSYARILGFREEALPLLRQIASHSSIPLILRMAEIRRRPELADNRLLAADLFASDLYRMTVQRKFGSRLPDEFSRKIIRLNS